MEMSMVKARQTSKKIKEQFEWKDETVEKLKTFRQEQTILYNINHLHCTNKTKRNAAVEKIQEGFAESGLINLPSADMVQEKISFHNIFCGISFLFL